MPQKFKGLEGDDTFIIATGRHLINGIDITIKKIPVKKTELGKTVVLSFASKIFSLFISFRFALRTH